MQDLLVLGASMTTAMGVLFTASTFGSVPNAVRLARSLDVLAGRRFLILTGPRREEMEDIRRQISSPSVIVLNSTVNNLYYCRGVGLAFAIHEGLEASYLCSCDDDLEFLPEGAGLIANLDEDWFIQGFSALTFDNNAQWYDNFGGTTIRNLRVGIAWINGDSMFVRWDDALACGVPDSLPDVPLTYYTEFEYQCRLQCQTGRPLVADIRRPIQYTHHFREAGPITDERAFRAGDGAAAALRFWEQKYGVVSAGVTDAERLGNLKATVCANPAKSRQHLIFGGLTPDWPAIWKMVRATVEVIG